MKKLIAAVALGGLVMAAMPAGAHDCFCLHKGMEYGEGSTRFVTWTQDQIGEIWAKCRCASEKCKWQEFTRR